jgi:hypothetical protein
VRSGLMEACIILQREDGFIVTTRGALFG